MFAYYKHSNAAEPNGVQKSAAAVPTREPTTINVSDGAMLWFELGEDVGEY